MNAKQVFSAFALSATLVASADITGLTDLTDDTANRDKISGNDSINGTSTSGWGAFNLSGATQTSVNNDNGGNRFAFQITASNPLTESNPLWVIYKFKTNTVVNAYRIWNQALNYTPVERAPKDFYLEGSTDGKTWTTLDSQSDQTGWRMGEPRVFEFRNKNAYTYYRMNFTANNGATDYLMIQEHYHPIG